MPTTYEKVQLIELDALLSRRFQELRQATVTFCCLMAVNKDGPAVRHAGNPAAAKIQVTSLADRARGVEDVKITIDGEVWDSKAPRGREALLAHELTHLVVRLGPSGGVQTDDLGRPKIGTRPDDYCINGFFDVARDYGEEAHELCTVRSVVSEYKQRGLWSDWDSPGSVNDGGDKLKITIGRTGERVEMSGDEFNDEINRHFARQA